MTWPKSKLLPYVFTVLACVGLVSSMGQGFPQIGSTFGLTTISNIAASIGGPTNGIPRLNGFGTNTTLLGTTLSTNLYGNGVGLTNLQGLLGQTNRTIYVDSLTGSDSTGNGTQEKPFKTIGYQVSDVEGTALFTKGGALGVAGPGDTIKLAPGIYTNEVVQLWITNKMGLNLIGAGRSATLITNLGLLQGGSAGQNIIQLGNNSVVADLSCTGQRSESPNNPWYNPIGNAVPTFFGTTMAADYLNGGQWTDFQLLACTNCVVKNCYFFGKYDAVFLGGGANYSIDFYDCVFEGNWDLFAVYGFNTNTVQVTRAYNCKFKSEGGTAQNNNVLHACDLHGGYHFFYGCDFKGKNGGTRTSLVLGGTYGVLAEDGFPPNAQTNWGFFYNCNLDVASTNTGVLALTNYTSAAGKSIVRWFGGQADYAHMTNWQGFVWNTNNSTFCQRGEAGASFLDGQGGAQFDAGATFANSAGSLGILTITSSGGIITGGNSVMVAGGDFTVPSGHVLDLGGAGEFSGTDGSLAGPVNWDGSGNMTATSFGIGSVTITSGSGAPSASVANGSIYLRTDGTGPNLYVRQNGAWVSK